MSVPDGEYESSYTKDLRGLLALVVAVVQWFSTVHIAVWRWGKTGHRFYGVNLIFATITPVAWAFFWGVDPGLVHLWYFSLGLTWLLLIQKLRCVRRHNLGVERCHSYYVGDGPFNFWCPDWKPENIRFAESGLAMCVGFLITSTVSAPLGSYLTFCALMALVFEGLIHARDERKVDYMEDGYIMSQQLARRLKSRIER